MTAKPATSGLPINDPFLPQPWLNLAGLLSHGLRERSHHLMVDFRLQTSDFGLLSAQRSEKD